MTLRFIFNPASGHNRRRPALAGSIRDFIRCHGLAADIVATEGRGHATQLAREAVREGRDIVVAVGGDGTMNEVAQALMGTATALALVPCGSGNGLARHLGLPSTPGRALVLAAGAGARIGVIDSGEADGRPFFNAMGLGLDANVSHCFNRLENRGLPAYARTTWRALRDIRTEPCTIHAEDQRVVLASLLIAVANSDQYGNNARIAPRARVDDGLLDLVAIQPVGWLTAAVLVGRLFLGRLDRSPAVRRMTGARFTIERAGAGLIHTDGETHLAGSTVRVVVRPRSLRVVVPADSSAAGPLRLSSPVP